MVSLKYILKMLTLVLVVSAVMNMGANAANDTAGNAGSNISFTNPYIGMPELYIIYSCRVIDKPGEYKLITNINSDNTSCIRITSSDVIIDGGGYAINGVDNSNTYGVHVYNSSIALTNITIDNLKVTNLEYGIYFNNISNGIITNSVASFNDYGIGLIHSNNNSIYNNYFNNFNNTISTRGSKNVWNLTKTPGTNIIRGPYLGGNFWADPYGKGFSQICADSDRDRICDSGYKPGSSSTDYLPLAQFYLITNLSPSSPVNDAAGAARTFNISVNLPANVTWYIDGTKVQTNYSVTEAIYTNTSATLGAWNVTAFAWSGNINALSWDKKLNAFTWNGDIAEFTWSENLQAFIWNENASITGAIWNWTVKTPDITRLSPPSPVNDTAGAARTFNISIDLPANVTWYIDGKEVQKNYSVTKASYTNTSAALGTWNVTAFAWNGDISALSWNENLDAFTWNENVAAFIWNENLHARIWNENINIIGIIWDWIVKSSSGGSTGGGSSSGGSSGGGGGGGGGVISGEPYDNIAKSESRDGDLVANVPVIYSFATPEIAIYQIAVTGKESENGVAIKVESLKGTSKLVNTSAPGTIYANLNIWASTKKIKEALVRFRVDNSWINSNSVSGTGIQLLKWSGDTWKSLETTQTGKDNIYTYFEAKTDTFSSFAVSSTKGEVSEATPEVNITTAETPAVTETSTIASLADIPSTIPAWLYALIAVMVIAIAMYFLVVKKGNK